MTSHRYAELHATSNFSFLQGASHPEELVERACALALGREPDAEERAALVEIATTHGLANACRTILNLNEFSFVY